MVFECLHERGLKLKPSKCDIFKSKIIYLAHHVSKDGVKTSHKNVASILECPVPKTFTDICSFTGAVGHYRHFIKGFAKKLQHLCMTSPVGRIRTRSLNPLH